MVNYEYLNGMAGHGSRDVQVFSTIYNLHYLKRKNEKSVDLSNQDFKKCKTLNFKDANYHLKNRSP
ncbi:hypothetical protein HanRHA438_Chr04g0154471 [Helianthus annuus]|nr:hypothetical protein HanRHA438_Chr04g0154471 [Helianthus annuus]